MCAGQLLRDEIDIAPAEFTVTALRSKAVDFLLPVTESHQKIFVKNPAESFNWTAFLEPLEWSCWGVIVIFIAVVPFFMARAVAISKNKDFFCFIQCNK